MNGIDPKQFEVEAKERWGDTDAYRESTRRSRKYTPEDWTRIKAELESVEADFAAALRGGESPDGDAAVALAERARLHIDRWFYPCSHRMHRGLADMYTQDARFAAHYDDREPGLSAFVADAIRANASRHGA